MSFGRLRQRIPLKCVPPVQHDYFSSFNQSRHYLLCRCRRLCLKLSVINYSSPLSFFPILIDLNWSRDAIVFIRRETFESLSNHDVAGNKNPTNLHVWQWKTVLLHALHVLFFLFLTFCRRSRSLYDVKWDVLQLCGRREHLMTNVQFQFVLLPLKRWSVSIYWKTVRTHLASV